MRPGVKFRYPTSDGSTDRRGWQRYRPWDVPLVLGVLLVANAVIFSAFLSSIEYTDVYSILLTILLVFIIITCLALAGFSFWWLNKSLGEVTTFERRYPLYFTKVNSAVEDLLAKEGIPFDTCTTDGQNRYFSKSQSNFLLRIFMPPVVV